MRKLLFASLVALLVPTASHAQWQLGARIGYASASGDAFKEDTLGTAKMSDTVKSQIPIQIEGSYKFSKDFAAGLYASYGFTQVADNPLCADAGVSCDKKGTDIRVGAQGIYSFNQVSGPFVPWAGISLGWEQASAEWSAQGESLKWTGSGWELGLQVGGDYKVSEKFSIGPYLTYSFGSYTSNDVTLSPGIAGFLGNPTLSTSSASHNWFGIGAIVKFDL